MPDRNGTEARALLCALGAALAAGYLANRFALHLEYHPIGDLNAFLATLGQSIASSPLSLSPEHSRISLVAACLAFAITATAMLARAERREASRFRGKEMGGARWATAREMEPFAAPALEENMILSKRARLSIPRIDGWTAAQRRVPARLRRILCGNPIMDRNKHVLVIGGSGAGKGYTVIGPNLLQAKYSFVLTDPKGDMVAKYGSYLLAHGYKVKVVNVKDPASFADGYRYNPLHYITSQASIMSLVNIIIENTKGEGERSGEDFFVKAERCMYMCLIAYLHYEFADNPAEQTIPRMLDLLALAEASEQDETMKSPLDYVFEDYQERLVGLYGSEDAAQCGPEWFAITQYEGYKKAAGETAKSILISCFVRLAPFAIGSLREMFSGDDLELERIGEEKTAFFLTMSDTDKTFNFILAMLLYQLFDINTALADKNPGSHCSIPIMCYLDELYNIGKVPDLDVKAATLRSRWINLCLFIQNMSQLEGRYGKEAAKVIAGNCDTLLFLGTNEDDTNEMISKRCGKETMVYKTHSDSRKSGRSTTTNIHERPLIAPSDLSGNPEEFDTDDCIVFIKNMPPFKDKKYDPDSHPNAAELKAAEPFDPAAYVSRMRVAEHRAQAARRREAAQRQQRGREEYAQLFRGMRQILICR